MATYGQFYVYPLVDKLPIWSDRDQAQALRIATRKEKLHVVRSEGALYCVRVLGVGYGYVRAEDVISEYEAAKQAAAARQAARGGAYASGATPGGVQASFQNAGFLERLLGYVIDSVMLFGIFYAIGVMLGVQTPGFHTEIVTINGVETKRYMFYYWPGGSEPGLAHVVSFVAGLTYWIGSWSAFGATPGKMALGQQIVHAQTGDRIGPGACFLRYIGTMISGLVLCVGYLWIIWDPQKQAWHDKIANTRVIRAR
jgi:uncharacterized RDD family membrane protein YckC